MSRSKRPRGSTQQAQALVARGEEAKRIVDSEVFRESMQWLHDEAMKEFHEARTPEDAWLARQSFAVMERFAAVLKQDLVAGRNAAEQLRSDLEPPRRQDDVASAVQEYMRNAAKARAEFSASQQAPAGEA